MEAAKEVVLIVDDEEGIRDSLRRAIARAFPRVEVLTAASGADALAFLEAGPIDLVVSDYKMPGMTGVDLLARIRAAAPKVRSILVTAHADLDVLQRATNEAHASRFLPKPFKLEEAMRMIGALLDERRASEARERALARAEALARDLLSR